MTDDFDYINQPNLIVVTKEGMEDPNSELSKNNRLWQEKLDKRMAEILSKVFNDHCDDETERRKQYLLCQENGHHQPVGPKFMTNPPRDCCARCGTHYDDTKEYNVPKVKP